MVRVFSFFQKYWLFVALAMIATLLAVLWVTRPKEVPVVEKKLPKIQKPSIGGQLINQNTQLILNIQPTVVASSPLSFGQKPPMTILEMTKIAQALDFTTEPLISQDAFLGPVASWSQKENFLTITPTTNEISFGRDLILSPPIKTGSLPNQETAKAQLFDLIENLGLSLTGIEVSQRGKFISFSGLIPITSPPQEAAFLELGLALSFNGVGIVKNNPDMIIIRAWFDRQGEIVKFEWGNPIAALTPLEEYPLKNQKEINQALLQEGRIMLIGDGGPYVPEVQNLSQIRISQAQLAYYLPLKENLIHPIFILSGETQDFRGQTFPIWIFLPAIKSNFLQP